MGARRSGRKKKIRRLRAKMGSRSFTDIPSVFHAVSAAGGGWCHGGSLRSLRARANGEELAERTRTQRVSVFDSHSTDFAWGRGASALQDHPDASSFVCIYCGGEDWYCMSDFRSNAARIRGALISCMTHMCSWVRGVVERSSCKEILRLFKCLELVRHMTFAAMPAASSSSLSFFRGRATVRSCRGRR